MDTRVVTPILILAALGGAILWAYLCTHYGLPISVSHALIGGLAGAGLAKAGPGALIVSGLVKVAVFIVLSPVIGLVVGALLMIGVSSRSSPPRSWPVCCTGC